MYYICLWKWRKKWCRLPEREITRRYMLDDKKWIFHLQHIYTKKLKIHSDIFFEFSYYSEPFFAIKGETRNLRNGHMRYGNEYFLIEMDFIDSGWLLTCLPNFLTTFFSRHPTGLGRPGWNVPKWPILANFWDILKKFFSHRNYIEL